MYSKIRAISYFLPEKILTNADIALKFPEWSVDKIASKIGISERHIAGNDEFASDLAANAALRLFKTYDINPDEIDFIILCTQSPDYFLPTTACLLQDRLQIPKAAGAIDVNLGCSGYVYSLGLAKALIESGQVRNVLVLTSDTYTKFINEEDKSLQTIFGDGASATLIDSSATSLAISNPSYGTDGSGGGHLIVPNGGMRPGSEISPKSSSSTRGLSNTQYDLFMDGPEIFNFTIEIVPPAIEQTLFKAGLAFEDIDLFVFHQANKFMLDHLRNRLEIPQDKFFVSMENSGNTVSSTIPIALSEANLQGKLKPGKKVLLLGFGVGLSWAGSVVTW